MGRQSDGSTDLNAWKIRFCTVRAAICCPQDSCAGRETPRCFVVHGHDDRRGRQVIKQTCKSCSKSVSGSLTEKLIVEAEGGPSFEVDDAIDQTALPAHASTCSCCESMKKHLDSIETLIPSL